MRSSKHPSFAEPVDIIFETYVIVFLNILSLPKIILISCLQITLGQSSLFYTHKQADTLKQRVRPTMTKQMFNNHNTSLLLSRYYDDTRVPWRWWKEARYAVCVYGPRHIYVPLNQNKLRD